MAHLWPTASVVVIKDYCNINSSLMIMKKKSMYHCLTQHLNKLAIVAANPPNVTWTMVTSHLLLNSVFTDFLMNWVKLFLVWADLYNADRPAGLSALVKA
jgi:hypothetical protein